MISPEMSQFLTSMDYPARPDDLVREAAREGLSTPDMTRLAELPTRSYSGRLDVLRELTWGRGGLLESLRSAAPVPA